ncbi:IclR family transcriptional regulator [Nocardia sp. NPDC060256]|uniref:IclR family transcriptional regulator n=1 Tax=unclassified Nocardia TaxID=2637762 RepID=UPI00365C7DB5
MPDSVDPPAAPSLLDKAAKILGCFEGAVATLTLTDVVRRTGLSQSTVHRLMDQLLTLGWLEREGRRYRLGLRLFELGAYASRHNQLRRAALPHLISLHHTTGHWAHLSVIDGAEVLYLDQIGDPSRSTLPVEIGTRLPVHCTAAGKILLAFGQPGTAETLAGDLVPRTRRTIIRADSLRNELTAAHRQGVAFDREETFPGVLCAAAPLRGSGQALGAISLSWKGTRVDRERMGILAGQCARTIWAALLESRRRYGQQHQPRTTAPADPDIAAVTTWLRFSEWQ